MQPFFEAYPANSGRLQYAPPFADHVDDIVLNADVLVHLAIPVGATFAVFSFDGDVRIKPGTAATTFDLPLATSSSGTGSELNPSARRLTAPAGAAAFTHLCLRAASPCTGSVGFFA